MPFFCLSWTEVALLGGPFFEGGRFELMGNLLVGLIWYWALAGAKQPKTAKKTMILKIKPFLQRLKIFVVFRAIDAELRIRFLKKGDQFRHVVHFLEGKGILGCFKTIVKPSQGLEHA